MEMGIYLNPGNEGFRRIIKSNYVDKTGLIALLNPLIGTSRNLTCVSRPRRFGKSYAAQMLCAYYDKSCDSAELFSSYAIADDSTYKFHLNRYHVINLDISGFVSDAKTRGVSLNDVPVMITDALSADVVSLYPDLERYSSLNECLLALVQQTGTKIIFIIDEWDAMIRETQQDPEAQDRYFNLLRGWFKNNNFTPAAIASAYMTGILPIKKDGAQSAISDFQEYTMIKPRKFGEYVGFTEAEVRNLCEMNKVSFETMKQWYDGYTFKDVGSVYNPNSVMIAIENDDFDSFWTETSASEGLMRYISQGYNGLTKTIAELISGVDVKVDTKGFANDLISAIGEIARRYRFCGCCLPAKT